MRQYNYLHHLAVSACRGAGSLHTSSRVCTGIHYHLQKCHLKGQLKTTSQQNAWFASSSHVNRQIKTYEEEKKEAKSYFQEFYSVVKNDVEKSQNKKGLIELKRLMEAQKIDPQRAVNHWIFREVIDLYIKQNPNRRRHVEFIDEALSLMKEFGVQRNIECYKSVMRVFPEGKMVAKSSWQAHLHHFPKQQDCAINVMDQMERNAVVPDREFRDIIMKAFGPRSQVMLKYRRMIYWMPKFSNANPYKLPHELPDCQIALALLALRKMAIDVNNKILVWKIKDDEKELGRETFITSAQSPDQQELLARHPTDVPLYVEGQFKVWLRNVPVTYFILRTDPVNIQEDEQSKEKDEDLFNFETIFESEEPKTQVAVRQSDHEQEDGTILAMCVTGTSSKESLIAWIRYLKESNPNLDKTPIVFTLRTPEEAIAVLKEKDQKTDVLKTS